MLYQGTTPEYWLQRHGLEDWWRFLGHGRKLRREEEEHMAIQIAVHVGVLFGGKLPEEKRIVSSSEYQPADSAGFHRAYGDRVRGGG
jgi:hypothetical protein